MNASSVHWLWKGFFTQSTALNMPPTVFPLPCSEVFRPSNPIITSFARNRPRTAVPFWNRSWRPLALEAVGCVGRSHLFQCRQDCLILTKDGVNGWGAHCPSCWAQRFECDVGTTCGLCNRLENGLQFAWLSKQAPQLMGPLQYIPHNRCGWASCLRDQVEAVRPTVNINNRDGHFKQK